MTTNTQTAGTGNKTSDRQFIRDIEQFISHHWQPGADPQAWFHALRRQGWLAPDWPQQYGGAGWSRRQQWWWLQATRRQLCPLPDDRFRVIAPLLLGVGRQRQCEQYLPGILDRTTDWGIAADTRGVLEATATADGWRLTGSLDYTKAPKATPSNTTNFCLLLQDPEPQLDMTLSLIDLTNSPVDAGDTEAGSLAITECSVKFNETFISRDACRNSLLGSPGKGRQHLAAHQSCYLILMELHLSAAHIAGALYDSRHEKSPVTRSRSDNPDAALAHRLTQFQISLDAMAAMFLRADHDVLLYLHAAELRTQAIEMLRDAIGYYALLDKAGTLESAIPESPLLKNNEPPLPFEAERQYLADLQRHLGQFADTPILSPPAQRDSIFKQIST